MVPKHLTSAKEIHNPFYDLRVGISVSFRPIHAISQSIAEIVCHALLGINDIICVGPEYFVKILCLLGCVVCITPEQAESYLNKPDRKFQNVLPEHSRRRTHTDNSTHSSLFIFYFIQYLESACCIGCF